MIYNDNTYIYTHIHIHIKYLSLKLPVNCVDSFFMNISVPHNSVNDFDISHLYIVSIVVIYS